MPIANSLSYGMLNRFSATTKKWCRTAKSAHGKLEYGIILHRIAITIDVVGSRSYPFHSLGFTSRRSYLHIYCWIFRFLHLLLLLYNNTFGGFKMPLKDTHSFHIGIICATRVYTHRWTNLSLRNLRIAEMNVNFSFINACVWRLCCLCRLSLNTRIKPRAACLQYFQYTSSASKSSANSHLFLSSNRRWILFRCNSFTCTAFTHKCCSLLLVESTYESSSSQSNVHTAKLHRTYSHSNNRIIYYL